MFFSKANRILKDINALELIPIIKYKFIEDDDKRIILQIPKFKNEKFARWFIPKRKSIYYSVKLDDLGSKVYKNIDGKKSIAEICNSINNTENTPVENIEERAISFLTQLYKYRFITFDQLIEDK